jgi:hypothetical protein
MGEHRFAETGMRNTSSPSTRLAREARSQTSLCRWNSFTNRSLRFESLESRRLLAVFTVTDLDDDPVAAALGGVEALVRPEDVDVPAGRPAALVNIENTLCPIPPTPAQAQQAECGKG